MPDFRIPVPTGKMAEAGFLMSSLRAISETLSQSNWHRSFPAFDATSRIPALAAAAAAGTGAVEKTKVHARFTDNQSMLVSRK